jgi:hypothetical protein
MIKKEEQNTRKQMKKVKKRGKEKYRQNGKNR